MSEPAIRKSKRQQIKELFETTLGQRYPSYDLHAWFGSAFRSRVSEINRDSSCSIVICNETKVVDGKEESVYWAEPRNDEDEEELELQPEPPQKNFVYAFA